MAWLVVRVTPRAAAERVGAYEDGVLALWVTLAARDGAANRASLRLVARALGVGTGRVRLVSGQRSRTKRLEVEGLDAGEIAARLRRRSD